MLRVARSFRRLTSPANHKARYWYKILVILALALSLSGVGQTTFVQAAPPANIENDSWDVSMSPIPSPTCAHSHYDLDFFARILRAVELGGQKVKLKGGFGPANVLVKATSSDPSVVEINPEIATATGLDGFIAVSSASFNLNAEAPGSATLTLRAVADWTGLQVVFPPLQQPIKVVNCRFKITINGISAGSGDNMLVTQVYTATGEIGGGPSGALTGDAEVTWHMTQVGDCYSSTITNPPSNAHLEGSLSEDGGTLTVRVTFDPLMVFNTVRMTGLCAYSGATATSQGQLQPAPIVFKVPSTGGSVPQPIALPDGALTLTGTAFIGVVPIEAK
jgi:hypothetical protein